MKNKQYIDKASVIAEIEDIESSAICEFKSSKSRYTEGCLDVIHRIKSFINTIEVKEIGVDLEKELGKYLDDNDIEFIHEIKLLDFAKHFFELGIKTQKEE